MKPGFDFEQIFSYELAPFPPSLFDKKTVLRRTKPKLKLMETLKVESNARLSASNPTAAFADGCTVVWHESWPKKRLP